MLVAARLPRVPVTAKAGQGPSVPWSASARELLPAAVRLALVNPATKQMASPAEMASQYQVPASPATAGSRAWPSPS